MEPVQSKAIRKTIYCFLMFFALRLIEELLFVPRLGSTKSFIACLGGLIILLIFIRFDNKSLDDIGVLFSGRKIGKGLGFAAAMNAVVAIAVFSTEIFQFKSYPGYSRLVLYYESPDRSFSAGIKTFLAWMGLALLVALVHALFYEIAFRGLMITLASRALPFAAVNLLQAGLYTVWFLVPVLRILLFSAGTLSRRQIVTLFLFSIVYEFLTALKLGMLRKASGAVWVCIFDHIAFSFIIDVVHMQYTNEAGALLTDSNYYVRALAYQAIALLISVIYYQSKMKKVMEKQQTAAIESTAQQL